MMTFGSLFAGIGGIDLGLERAGMRCVWQVEIDEYCQKVLEKHWPEVPRYGDIRTLKGMANTISNGTDERDREKIDKGKKGKQHTDKPLSSSEGRLPYADLICGGFPCQDISYAGKGEGIKGKRSGLWNEMARLVGEIRPRYVLVENVPALLSKGIDKVLGDLAEIGYDAEWDCISARSVGAPHLRRRIFIVAYTRSPERTRLSGIRWEEISEIGRSSEMADTNNRREIPIPQQGQGDGVEQKGEDVANSQKMRIQGVRTEREQISKIHAGERIFVCESIRSGAWRKDPAEDPSTESFVGRVAYGVPNRVDRLKCLGNAVVPQIAEFIGRRIIMFDREME